MNSMLETKGGAPCPPVKAARFIDDSFSIACLSKHPHQHEQGRHRTSQQNAKVLEGQLTGLTFAKVRSLLC
jgi:hypothetical protein